MSDQAEQAQTRKPVGRRRFLIYPSFQLLLIGVNFAVLAVFTIVIWISVQNALTDLKPVAPLSGLEVEFYKHYIEYQSKNFNNALLVALFLGLGVSGTFTLVVSHRLAGPLVRMRGFFQNLKENPKMKPNLSFRQGDYLTELPPIINDAISQVQSESK